MAFSPALLLCSGCFLRGAAEEPTDATANAAKNSAEAKENESDVKNEIVRRLLDKLDETDADPESIRTVRKMLLEADKELSQALAGNGRVPKGQAGSPRQDGPADSASSPSRAKQELPAPATGQTPENGPSNSSKPDKPKTRIVEALLTVLDEIANTDKDAEDVVRDALTQADSQLAEVLGSKSKERILRANRKPQVRMPVEPPRRSPKNNVNGNHDSDGERSGSPGQD
ncbi:hypothetical protein JCM17478_02820 [Thermopirellula anaerolimosa]